MGVEFEVPVRHPQEMPGARSMTRQLDHFTSSSEGLFIYLFLAELGLCCCARAFSGSGEQGLLFAAVRGLLLVVASLVAEHGL